MEVLGVQAVRRALDEVRNGSEDALTRDRLARIDSVLARVAALLGREEAFRAGLADRPADLVGGVRWDHSTATQWEREVAAFDPRTAVTEEPQDDLAYKLDRYLKRLRGPGAPEVKKARRLPGGRSKHTLIVDLAPSADLPERIVLRTDSTRTTEHDNVAREYPLVRAMFEAGVPLPQPFWFEGDESVIGAAFIAFAHSQGAAAGDLWGAIDKSGAPARELARVLGQVHAVPVSRVPIAAPATARAGVEALLASYEARWRASMPRASSIIGNAFEWLRARLDRVEGPPVVVHGDAHFSNMLMLDGKLTSMLDWEFWHFGHPAEDVAYARPYVGSAEEWQVFLDIYRASGGAEVTDAQLDLFAIWRPLRNAVLASVVACDFAKGGDLDLETAAIALSTFPRMEGQVAAALDAAI